MAEAGTISFPKKKRNSKNAKLKFSGIVSFLSCVIQILKKFQAKILFTS